MSNRDRWLGLAGICGGIGFAIAVLSGVLLWQLSADASPQALFMTVRISMIVVPLFTITAIFIRYRVVGFDR